MAKPDPVQAGIALEDLEGAAFNMLFSERTMVAAILRDVVAPMVAQQGTELATKTVLQLAEKIGRGNTEIIVECENAMVSAGLKQLEENTKQIEELANRPKFDGVVTISANQDVLKERMTKLESRLDRLVGVVTGMAGRLGVTVLNLD